MLKEIKPVERSGSKTAETVMALERSKIEAAIPKGARIVALDERGRDLTTMDLSQLSDYSGNRTALMLHSSSAAPTGWMPDSSSRPTCCCGSPA